MKIVEALIKCTVAYFLSVGFVALGWNVILTKIFNVPVFNFGEICWLTLAISLLGTPITIMNLSGKKE